MNLKRLTLMGCVLFVMSLYSSAQQPFGGSWHPDFIETWTSDKDPDVKFNRASIPLQPRFEHNVKANERQFKEGKLAACLTLNPMCSQTPSQGANNFIGYNPNYWQYLDLMIWWGGAAAEGIFIPPSAPVIDACHQSGVKILGNVFFPPTAFGGQARWVTQTLKKDGEGKYIFARKLYEIAKYYGFDGWFINEETVGGSLDQWTQFVKEYAQYAQADPTTRHHEIQWYDMATTVGNRANLIAQPGGSMFLNYGSPNAGNIQAQKDVMKGMINPLTGVDFTEAETFSKLYFGVEQAQGGILGNGDGFNNAYPTTGHKASLDVFCPEYPIWKQVVDGILNTPNAQGSVAYEKMSQVFRNEETFWVGAPDYTTGWTDVTKLDSRGWTWPGLSDALQERSTIQTKPFITAFSAGLGKYRFVNGEKRGTQDWYHRGMQNILPTWRWWVETTGTGTKADLRFNYEFDEAYNMGSCLKIGGKLAASTDYLIRLYKTKIAIANGDQLQFVFKGVEPGVVSLKLSTEEDGDANFTSFPCSSTATSNGWTVATIDLSSLAGKKLSVIALNLRSTAEVANLSFKMGQLSVFAAGYAPSTPSVTNFACQNEATTLTETEGQFRLVWDKPSYGTYSHFNIYMERDGGQKTLVGQTRNEGFYIPKFNRASVAEKWVKLYIRTVNNKYEEGTEQMLQVNYPALQKPVVSIKVMKTLASTTDQVRLIARATNFPQTYTWRLPENCTKVGGNGSNEIVVQFSQEGTYTIGVDVVNEVGVTNYNAVNCVEVSSSKLTNLLNRARGGQIVGQSGSLDQHPPTYLIDGATTPGSLYNKWCNGGLKEHWVVIDLLNVYSLYKFMFYDCGVKESSADNVTNYKILVSLDKENWTELVNEKGRPENIKEDWCVPTAARYVKFVPYNEETPMTIRIWEFEAYGLPAPLQIASVAPINMLFNEVKAVSCSYTMSEAFAADASVSVVPKEPSKIGVSNVVWDKQSNTVNFDLTAKREAGLSSVTLNMVSGSWNITQEIGITIKDPDVVNVSAGKTASFQRIGEAVTQWTDEAKLTDGNVSEYFFGSYTQKGLITTFRIDMTKQHILSELKMNFASRTSMNRLDSVQVWTSNDPLLGDQAEWIGTMRFKTGEYNPSALLKAKSPGRYAFLKLFALATYGQYYLNEIELQGKEDNTTDVELTELGRSVRTYVQDGVLLITAPIEVKYEIFNAQGNKLKGGTTSDDITRIDGLVPGQLYIVRAGGVLTKVIF